MEEVILFIVFVGLPLFICSFVLPIIAFVKSSGAKKTVRRLEEQLWNLESEVTRLKEAMQSESATPPRMPQAQPQAPTPTPSKSPSGPVSRPVSGHVEDAPSPTTHRLDEPKAAEQVRSVADIPASQAPAVTPEVPSSAVREPPDDPPRSEDTVAEASPGTDERPGRKASDSAAPRSDVASPPPVDDGFESPRPAPASIEERIGVVWFTRIGAAVGMVVAGWFFKYMVDNDWIGPWGRVAVGAAVGMAILALGELLYRRGKTHALFNQGLSGLGLALLLITTYASFGFYHLVPVTGAFAVTALLCVFGGALAHVHRSEPILVFSLAAAFLNPVMLSTGQDRPFALFAYLLLMTSGALLVAVRNAFRVATWIGFGGVVVMFMGWYGRYFDVSPPPPPGVIDRFPEELRGAYYPLSGRAVPLIFAALFPLQWGILGNLFEKRGRAATATVLFVSAAMTAHGAYSALLYDRPLVLGGVLIGLGALFSALFVTKKRTEWLGLPMLISFTILAALSHKLADHQILGLLGITGALSAFYFAVFLRTAVTSGRLESPLSRILIGGAGGGLFLLSMIWLMPDHFELLGGMVLALSAVYLVLAVALRSPVMMITALAASALGMLVAGSRCEAIQTGFLLISAAWFLLHVAVIAVDIFRRGTPWTAVHQLTLAGAGVGFLALFLQSTPASAETLRTLLSLASGGVYLVIGIRTGADRRASLLPLGMALVFFTLGLAFLLAGPSLTVAWAVEAAVLAFLTSRSRSEGNSLWLAATLSVFVAAVVHLMATDLPWLGEQQQLFLSTAGKQGLIMPTPFLNPTAFGLSALGLSALASVVFLRRLKAHGLFRGVTVGLIVAGHTALLSLFILEMRGIFTDVPDIPRGLAQDEMLILWRAFQAGLEDQATRLATVTTVVMGVYAVLLLVLGFALREAWHRRLGIGLFAVTLVKLGLFDIWAFETLYKIIVGGAVAFLLLLSGFLYARFGSRLKGIVSDTDTFTGGILFFALVSAASPGQAAERDQYEQTREITGVAAPGDYRAEIDPALFAASRAGGAFSDVRIVDAEGREVPYFITEGRDRREAPGIRARVFDAVALEDNTTEAVIDLGEKVVPHVAVEIEVDGTDYLRTARVASSRDGEEFGTLAGDQNVFDLPAGSRRAVMRRLEYPPSTARYLKITLLPGADARPLRITAARIRAEEKPSVPLVIREVEIPIAKPPYTEKKKTVIELGAIPREVPFHAIAVETGDPEFIREVTVEATTNRQAWFPVGGGAIYRIRREAGSTPEVIEGLEVSVSNPTRPHWRLVVDNGDNAPLGITKVIARYRAKHLAFRARAAGPLTLLVGRERDRAPRYDLAALVAKGSAAQFKTARLGPPRPNPALSKIEAEKTLPWTERHAGVIQIAAAAILLLLLIWTIRLLAKSRSGQG